MLRMVILKEIVKSVLRKLKACNGEITKLKARKAYRESLKHAMEKLQSYATIQLRSISMPLCNCIEKHEKQLYIFFVLLSSWVGVLRLFFYNWEACNCIEKLSYNTMEKHVGNGEIVKSMPRKSLKRKKKIL